MKDGEKDRRIAELRKAEIERLSSLPKFPEELPDDERGILLSDRIKKYCTQYRLIWPFDEKQQLRPAAYSLCVGRNYSIRGVPGALNDGMSLSIEPYEVAIIETYETINMPPYFIGRWNVRTKRAYQGLLWVGGAQVDPGFRGHLCCPIYNLSAERVTLDFRDKLAEIDFATTTAFDPERCERFDWRSRDMVVFPEYPPLSSGIKKKVDEFQKDIEKDRREVQGRLDEYKKETKGEISAVTARIDTFLTLTFTVLAVLFAGLGIIATRPSEQPSFLSPPLWVAAIAFFFSLRALGYAYRGGSSEGRFAGWLSWIGTSAVALPITGAIVGACMLFSAYHGVDLLKKRLQHNEARIEVLQRQVTELQNQARQK